MWSETDGNCWVSAREIFARCRVRRFFFFQGSSMGSQFYEACLELFPAPSLIATGWAARPPSPSPEPRTLLIYRLLLTPEPRGPKPREAVAVSVPGQKKRV
jgi:hypothetical protein